MSPHAAGSLASPIADIESLQNLLVTRATGGHDCDPEEFRRLRERVVKHAPLKDFAPEFLCKCRTLDEFWEFIKHKFPHYHERRQFLWDQFRPLLERAEAKGAPSQSESVRVWGREPGFRVFLSHVSAEKVQVAALKERLRLFGVTAFVAHEDIVPSAEWQDEIENALASMDAFVALLSESFHHSNWTDQEVGFALARGVPMLALSLGYDPYGFMGKFQALKCAWEDAPGRVVQALIRHERMLDAYIAALPGCKNFEQGNQLASVFPSIEHLSPAQAERIVEAHRSNPELRGSFGFGGGKPLTYGEGLAKFLSHTTGYKYEFAEDGTVNRAVK